MQYLTAANNRRKLFRKNKKVYVVFVNLEKAFGRVDWYKLVGILKKNWYGLETEDAFQ